MFKGQREGQCGWAQSVGGRRGMRPDRKIRAL